MLEIKENINNFPANLMVVLQLFDNVAFHTITKEELPSHARRTSIENIMKTEVSSWDPSGNAGPLH